MLLYPPFKPALRLCLVIGLASIACSGRKHPPPAIDYITLEPSCIDCDLATFPAISPEIPDELPHTPTPNRRIVGDFAWQTFLALSYPAAGGDAPVHGGDEGPTVWETWESVDEVFPIPGSACQELKGSDERWASAEVLSMDTGLSDEVEFDDSEVGCLDYVLLDAREEPVFREITLDPTVADFIRREGYQDREVVERIDRETFEFPHGTILIKAAWKIFDPERDDPDEFYVRDLLIEQDGHCEEQRAALVALHIVRKTDNFRGWLWLTFEQGRNAPTRRDPDEMAADGWTFYDPLSDAAYNELCLEGERCPPAQVVRINAIDGDARQVNAEWKEALEQVSPGSVWRHYELVGTQWQQYLSQTSPHGNRRLANTILETSCQELEWGCMSCHQRSQTHDTSFVLSHAR